MKSPKTKRANKGVIKQRRSLTPEPADHRFAQIAKRIFESFPDAILLIESGGKITEVNAQAQSIFGYRREELVGKSADVLIAERCRELFVKHISGTVAGPQVRLPGVGLELFGRRKNQGEFSMAVALSSIASDGDSLVMVVVRDLTEAKQAAERARRTNAELTALVAELQRRDHEMQALISMDDLLQSCTTQDEAYKVVALAAGELFESQTGSLAVMHTSGQFLEIVARWGDGPLGDPIFSVEDCWALRRGQVHEVTDPDAGLLCRHVVRQPDRVYLCMPLTVQGETLGVFCLTGARDNKNTQQVGQLQLVATVSEAIKLSLSNLRLREKLRAEAIHDPLTGLFNRRYLEETLPRELHRARRTNAPLSVVMLDLDGFKRFNDTYGHDAGDSLLRELGKLVREKLRKSDISCRYGGEEFVLVLPDSSLADAEHRVEQIRAQIKEMQIPHGDQLLRAITVSAGVAQADERTANPSELLRAADSALYAAKNAGRDRVVVYRGKETLQ